MLNVTHERFERLSGTRFEEVEFEELALGDVFRVVGEEKFYTAMSRPHPVIGTPGKWTVYAEQTDPPAGMPPHVTNHLHSRAHH